MRAAARFHADQARRQVGKKHCHLLPPQLLAQHGLAALIHTVNLKHVLCHVDANSRNLHGGRSPQFSGC